MTSRRGFLGIAAAGSALAAGGFTASRPGSAAPETGAQSGAGEPTGHYIPSVKFGLGGVPLGNEFEVVTDEVTEPRSAPYSVGATAQPGPEQEAISRATRAELLRCVAELGEDQRECIVLRFLQGLSVAETAEIMNRNEGAVKAKFFLMSFEQKFHQSWTFARAGDRLVAVQHREEQSGSGLGQNFSGWTATTVTLR